MATKNLTRLLSQCPELERERLKGYLIEAAKEFSFTGFSSYFALAKRTLQLVHRDHHLDGLEAADRAELLSEPDGLLVREIASLIPEAHEFPSAWRFVRRTWEFSPQFRSSLGVIVDPDNPMGGPAMQRHIARACGVMVPLDASRVPLEYRRER